MTQFELTNALLNIMPKNSGITGVSKAVLVQISKYWRENGQCFRSISTLANYTGFGVSTVKRAIALLIKAEYIKKKPRFSHSGRSSNEYEFNLPAIKKKVSKQPDNVALAETLNAKPDLNDSMIKVGEEFKTKHKVAKNIDQILKARKKSG